MQHSGWGPGLFIKDLFPDSKYLCYFEWFYHARGLSPTSWQRQQFPPEFQGKIQVLHDGIDTNYFQACANRSLALPRIGLALSAVAEIVTYVARG